MNYKSWQRIIAWLLIFIFPFEQLAYAGAFEKIQSRLSNVYNGAKSSYNSWTAGNRQAMPNAARAYDSHGPFGAAFYAVGRVTNPAMEMITGVKAGSPQAKAIGQTFNNWIPLPINIATKLSIDKDLANPYISTKQGVASITPEEAVLGAIEVGLPVIGKTISPIIKPVTSYIRLELPTIAKYIGPKAAQGFEWAGSKAYNILKPIDLAPESLGRGKWFADSALTYVKNYALVEAARKPVYAGIDQLGLSPDYKIAYNLTGEAYQIVGLPGLGPVSAAGKAIFERATLGEIKSFLPKLATREVVKDIMLPFSKDIAKVTTGQGIKTFSYQGAKAVSGQLLMPGLKVAGKEFLEGLHPLNLVPRTIGITKDVTLFNTLTSGLLGTVNTVLGGDEKSISIFYIPKFNSFSGAALKLSAQAYQTSVPFLSQEEGGTNLTGVLPFKWKLPFSINKTYLFSLGVAASQPFLGPILQRSPILGPFENWLGDKELVIGSKWATKGAMLKLNTFIKEEAIQEYLPGAILAHIGITGTESEVLQELFDKTHGEIIDPAIFSHRISATIDKYRQNQGSTASSGTGIDGFASNVVSSFINPLAAGVSDAVNKIAGFSPIQVAAGAPNSMPMSQVSYSVTSPAGAVIETSLSASMSDSNIAYSGKYVTPIAQVGITPTIKNPIQPALFNPTGSILNNARDRVNEAEALTTTGQEIHSTVPQGKYLGQGAYNYNGNIIVPNLNSAEGLKSSIPNQPTSFSNYIPETVSQPIGKQGQLNFESSEKAAEFVIGFRAEEKQKGIKAVNVVLKAGGKTVIQEVYDLDKIAPDLKEWAKNNRVELIKGENGVYSMPLVSFQSYMQETKHKDVFKAPKQQQINKAVMPVSETAISKIISSPASSKFSLIAKFKNIASRFKNSLSNPLSRKGDESSSLKISPVFQLKQQLERAPLIAPQGLADNFVSQIRSRISIGTLKSLFYRGMSPDKISSQIDKALLNIKQLAEVVERDKFPLDIIKTNLIDNYYLDSALRYAPVERINRYLNNVIQHWEEIPKAARKVYLRYALYKDSYGGGFSDEFTSFRFNKGLLNEFDTVGYNRLADNQIREADDSFNKFFDTFSSVLKLKNITWKGEQFDVLGYDLMGQTSVEQEGRNPIFKANVRSSKTQEEKVFLVKLTEKSSSRNEIIITKISDLLNLPHSDVNILEEKKDKDFLLIEPVKHERIAFRSLRRDFVADKGLETIFKSPEFAKERLKEIGAIKLLDRALGAGDIAERHMLLSDKGIIRIDWEDSFVYEFGENLEMQHESDISFMNLLRETGEPRGIEDVDTYINQGAEEMLHNLNVHKEEIRQLIKNDIDSVRANQFAAVIDALGNELTSTGKINISITDRPVVKIKVNELKEEVLKAETEPIRNLGQPNADSSQIGKLAKGEQVIQKDNKKSLKVSYTKENVKVSKEIELTPVDNQGLIKPLQDLIQVNPQQSQILEAFLGILQKSPPEFYTFSTLIEDLFGFSSSQDNIITLHQDLSSNPVAVFHEIGEYLIDSKAIELKLNEANQLVIINKQTNQEIAKIGLKGESLAIANKDPKNPHYLLRALQRGVFGEKDRELTKEIKEKQVTNSDSGGRKGWRALDDAVEIKSLIKDLLGKISHSIKIRLAKNLGSDDIEKYSSDAGKWLLGKNRNLIEVIIKLTGINDASRWKGELEDIIKRQFEKADNRPLVEPITNSLDAISKGSYLKEVDIIVRENNVAIVDKAGGMDLGEIIAYLVVPKISGSRGQEGAVAQFGVGFYSLLNLLKKPGDELIVRTYTSTSKDGYEVVYTFKDNMEIANLYITIRPLKNIDRNRGTEVLIKSSFNPESVVKEIKDALSYNQRAKIYVDYNNQKVLINDLSLFRFITSGSAQALVKETDSSEHSEVVLTIMGVKIFSIPLIGKNIPKKLAVELSEPSLVPRARNQIEVNAKARAIVKELVEKILAQADWRTINGLVPLLERLDEENKSSEDKLLDYLYKRLFGLAKENNIIFIPDIDKLQQAKDGAVLIHPQVFSKLISLGYRPGLKKYGFYIPLKKFSLDKEANNKIEWVPNVNAVIYAIDIQDENIGLVLISNDIENGPIFLLNKKYLPKTTIAGIVLDTLIEFILGQRGDYEAWDSNIGMVAALSKNPFMFLQSSAFLKSTIIKYNDIPPQLKFSDYIEPKFEMLDLNWIDRKSKAAPTEFSLSLLPFIINLINGEGKSADIATLKKLLEEINKGKISINPLGRKYNERDIQTSVDQQNIAPYINIRENGQNTRDEAIRQGRKGKLNIKAEISGDKKRIILTFEDDFGMDAVKLLQFLLNPGASDKRDDQRLTGRFGRGFLTNLKDAQEVKVKTSLGDGQVIYVSLKPIRNTKQETTDIKVSIFQKPEQYKGTEIEVIKNVEGNSEAELSYILKKAALYVGLIDKNILEITLNGNALNKGSFREEDLLSWVDTTYGKLSFYHHPDRRAVTHKQLYVGSINEQYVKAIPPFLLEILLKHGIIIDLPNKLELISDRSGLTLSDEKLKELEKATFAAAIMAAARLYIDGLREVVELFPYDFDDPEVLLTWEARCPDDVREDLQNIRKGSLEKLDIDKYSADKDKLVYLISVFPVHKDMSITQLIIEIATGKLSIEGMPPALAKELARKRNELMRKIRGDSNGKVSQIELEKITQLSPFAPDILKNYPEFVIYSLLAEFLSKTASLLLGKEIKVMFTADLERGASAYTWRGSDTIVWNLAGMNRRIEQLSRLLKGTMEVDEPEARELIGGLILGVCHEATHIPESAGRLTHNTDFKTKTIELMQNIALEDNAEKIAKIIDTLKNPQANFVSTALFTEQMAENMKEKTASSTRVEEAAHP